MTTVAKQFAEAMRARNRWVRARVLWGTLLLLASLLVAIGTAEVAALIRGPVL